MGSRKKAIFQSHIREFADKKTAYNEGTVIIHICQICFYNYHSSPYILATKLNPQFWRLGVFNLINDDEDVVRQIVFSVLQAFFEGSASFLQLANAHCRITRCQFHQRFTYSFYARRSLKRKNIQLSHQYLFTLSRSARLKAVRRAWWNWALVWSTLPFCHCLISLHFS